MPRRPTPKPAKRSYGAGSVYQRKDTRWVASISHQGVRYQRYFGSQAEARRYLRETVRAMQDGSFSEPSRQPLGDYLESWLDGRRHELAPNSQTSYRDSIRSLGALLDLPLSSLRPRDVDATWRALRDRGRSPKAIQRIRSVLGSALRDAQRLELIPTNPVEATRAPRQTPAPPMTIWDGEQIQRFLTSTADDRLAALWELLFAAGLRNGEARGLLWLDIDWSKRLITIQRSLASNAKREGSTKTHQRRDIPLTPSLGASLRAHRSRQLEERLQAGPKWRECGRVFVLPDGRPMTRDQLWYRFDQARIGAGLPTLPRIRLHDTRHAAISWMLSQGVPVATVAAIAGHSSPAMTLSRYAHAMPQDWDRASVAMDELLRPRQTAQEPETGAKRP